jgi:hypothetical protein
MWVHDFYDINDKDEKYKEVVVKYYFYKASGWTRYPITYRAQTSSEVSAWLNNARAAISSGSASTGGLVNTITNTSSSSGATGSTAAGAAAVSSTFMPALSADRLESYLDSLKKQMQTAKDAIIKALPPSFYKTGSIDSIASRIDQQVKSQLRSRGFTDAQIAWFLSGGRVNPITGGIAPPATTRPTGGGGSVKTQDPTVPPTPTPVKTKVKIKAPFGYIEPPKVRTGRPHLYQTFPAVPDYKGKLPDAGASAGRALTEVFYFPYTPNNVQYSGLGSTWTELPRTGDFPIVEWSNYNLLKISFEFLIAAERTETGGAVVPDGMFIHVEDQIEKLRKMAQRPFPVSVYGWDNLLRVAIRRAADTGRPLEFVIADLQISAIRRTSDSTNSRIAAASVKLTLQEKPVELVKVANFKLPVIAPTPAPPTKKTTTPPPGTVVPISDVALAGIGGSKAPIRRPRPTLGKSVPW